jgi:hypothetical protein
MIGDLLASHKPVPMDRRFAAAVDRRRVMHAVNEGLHKLVR